MARKRAKPDHKATQRSPLQERIHLAWTQRHQARAIEERSFRKHRAELLDRWGHKNQGTPETHAAVAILRAGAIARLHASGYLNDDELAWADEIAAAAERIVADATVRTASFEGRVDSVRHGHAFFEALGAVWSEMAYSRWRTEMGPTAALVLDMVLHDVGIARAAANHGMHVRRARRVLTEALTLWARIHRAVRDEVSEADLLAAQAGIL